MKHVKFIHHTNEAWCGHMLEHFEPHFKDIEQVIFHKLDPSTTACCTLCLDKITTLLRT